MFFWIFQHMEILSECPHRCALIMSCPWCTNCGVLILCEYFLQHILAEGFQLLLNFGDFQKTCDLNITALCISQQLHHVISSDVLVGSSPLIL